MMVSLRAPGLIAFRVAADVDTGTFALLKSDMGLSTGKASKWFKAMEDAVQLDRGSGVETRTPAATEATPPAASAPSERVTPASSRALSTVGRSTSTMDGLFGQARDSDVIAPAHVPSITLPIDQLTPTSVDSQTFSAWVGGIPLKHADEATLYQVFEEVGLGRESILKITVRVKDNKPNGSWALVALATIEDMRAILAATIRLEDGNGKQAVLQVRKSEVGKQLEGRARRMSYEGNLSAVSMAHAIGAAHEMQKEAFSQRHSKSAKPAVATMSSGGDVVEHLSVWVGNIPAEFATSAAITKVFAEHGCEALFCTPRVKAPPKMSWAVVALASDAMAAVALTTDMVVQTSDGESVQLNLKEYTPKDELALKERRMSVQPGALDSISIAHALNVEGMLLTASRKVMVSNIPAASANHETISALFASAGFQAVQTEVRFAPGRQKSSALLTFSDTAIALGVLQANIVTEDEDGNPVSLRIHSAEDKIVVAKRVGDIQATAPTTSSHSTPVKLIPEGTEVGEGSLQEWVGEAVHALIAESLDELGVEEVGDLLHLSEGDILELTGKMKKVQASKFTEKIAMLSASTKGSIGESTLHRAEGTPLGRSASGSSVGSPRGPIFELPLGSSLGRSGKRWTGFLSHYKDECASPARQMKTELTAELSKLGTDAQVYLDSDDLRDLRRLLDAVKDSEVLVLLQTRHLLSRPWVLLEIYTAITNSVPIVTVQVQGPNSYSFSDAQVFLDNFPAELERRNPGAGRLVLNHVQEGHDLAHIGQLLRAVIPYVISKTFTPAASMNVLRAEMADLIIAMDEAVQEGAPVVQHVDGRFQVKHTEEYNRRARGRSAVLTSEVADV